MKRSVILTTAILLVVTALCLTAATFSFFSSRSSNIEIDIGSLGTNAFTFNFTRSENNLIATNSTKIGSSTSPSQGEVILGKDYIYCDISYTTSQEYKNMYFTVKEFTLKDSKGNIIVRNYPSTPRPEGEEIPAVPPIESESDYIAKNLQYQFINTNINGVLVQDPVPDPTKWKVERPFVPGDDFTSADEREQEFFNLGALKGSETTAVKGGIRFCVRLAKPDGTLLDTELVPSNINGYTLTVLIQAKQLS